MVVAPKYNLEYYGKPTFSFIARSPWDKLAHQLRTTACLSSFFTERTFYSVVPFRFFSPQTCLLTNRSL